ncbi:hypothetical protein J1N35_016653 [Gossypium stocksii]|uniref:Uncharacterized protein n=1 Tax=Gossypium stocksii TaxID=47602 RepID=A0A9D4A5G2_9ROSI|nr:hypothetical protein J1N35_016653 [Gossypium stocksii]
MHQKFIRKSIIILILESKTSAETTALRDQILQLERQNLHLQKQLQVERERNNELIKRLEESQREARKKKEMTSYAGAVAGQPITREDKIIDVSAIINGLSQFDERPSEGWDQISGPIWLVRPT